MTDRAKEAQLLKEKEAQVAKEKEVSQQRLQLQQALAEVLEPVQTALVDLQGKYQTLLEKDIQSSKSTVTPEEDIEQMVDDLNNDDRYEKLTNKQMLNVISTSLDAALKSNAQSVKEGVLADLKPTLEKVGTIEKSQMQLIANMGVQAASTKYKDFDEHIEGIKSVLKTYPGMDYGDAYLLAKSQKAGDVPPKDQIETEKPQSPGAVSPGQPNPTQLTDQNLDEMANRGREARSGKPHGRVGFMQIAEAAADKILSARE